MVQAWYMDNELSDQRLEHHRNPPQYLPLDELYKKTGVEYFNVSFASCNVTLYLLRRVMSRFI